MGTLLKYGCQHKHCCGSAAPFVHNLYIIVPAFQRRRLKTSENGLECPARLVDATRIRTSKITRSGGGNLSRYHCKGCYNRSIPLANPSHNERQGGKIRQRSTNKLSCGRCSIWYSSALSACMMSTDLGTNWHLSAWCSIATDERRLPLPSRDRNL